MRELVRTNNPALLSYIEALLKDAGLSFFIADRNISVVEGSIGAFRAACWSLKRTNPPRGDCSPTPISARS